MNIFDACHAYICCQETTENKSMLASMQFNTHISARNFYSIISKLGNIKKFVRDCSKFVVKATILICENNLGWKS